MLEEKKESFEERDSVYAEKMKLSGVVVMDAQGGGDSTRNYDFI